MVRNGACHCGTVKFTADIAEPPRGARCDCSICSTKGAVTVGTPLEGLQILAGEDALTLYQRRSDPNTYGVNVACLGLNPYHDFPDVAVVDGIRHVRDSGKARLAGRLRFEPAPPE